jgi:hypothetical protein
MERLCSLHHQLVQKKRFPLWNLRPEKWVVFFQFEGPKYVGAGRGDTPQGQIGLNLFGRKNPRDSKEAHRGLVAKAQRSEADPR